ncbi:MAG: DUF5710 domain-containing protein, partial [Legionella sp.]|uniref:DUF5710 domain-containing protein n=1 Tax=Legionella sp. TaxID=459 RepID=UPI00283ACB10|nr:DUF5710 domain-containing protein [Legionella sp.]
MTESGKIVFVFNVPFKEKDSAKRLGCRWNPDEKHWYYKCDLKNYEGYPDIAIPYDFPITEVKCDDKDDTELDAIKKKVNKRHCYNLVKNIKTDPSLFGK